MKLSHSKLNTILTCPMTYYLSYELGIRKKETKPALAIGSAVHWGIEHNTNDLSEYWNIEKRNIDNYTKEQLLAESMVYAYQKHKDELFEKLLTNPETGEKLELIEELHELYLNAELKSTHFSENHNFVGIIDLLLLTNKGFILVDYKTSSQIPNWDDYLDQLYRYIFELQSNFPDTPIVKIAIINLRKSSIRQKRNENQFEFLNHLKFKYEINDENLVNYHEFLPNIIDKVLLNNYIDNLSKMADTAQTIVDNKLRFINYGAAKAYGGSEFYDIFYKTPNAELLYEISDYIWNEDTQQFVDKRDCLSIDMKVIDYDNVLDKYSLFKELLLATSCQSKEEFFTELSETYIVDINLLELYWTTFIKEKELKGSDEKNARQ